jgi:O-antigen/teichoic acid export membrane protein
VPGGSVRRNALALLAARLLGGGANLASLVVAARSLTPSAFGELVVVTAVVALANTATTFGTDDVVVRSVARGDTSHVGGALRLQWALALVVAFVVGMSAVVDRGPVGGWALVGTVALAPMAVVSVTTAVLRGVERSERVLVAALVGSAVQLAGFAWAGAADSGVGGYVAALVAGQLAGATVGVVAARSVLGAGSRWWGGDSAVAVASRSWRFAAMVLGSALIAQAGVLMVGALAGETGAGHHGLATRVSETLRLVPAAAYAALFPVLARGDGGVRRTRSRGRLVAGTVALVALGWGLAPVVWPTRWLVLGLPAVVWRLDRSTVLLAADREREVLRITLGVLPVALCGLGVGAAAAGAPGAALATTGAVVLHAALLSVAAGRVGAGR